MIHFEYILICRIVAFPPLKGAMVIIELQKAIAYLQNGIN